MQNQDKVFLLLSFKECSRQTACQREPRKRITWQDQQVWPALVFSKNWMIVFILQFMRNWLLKSKEWSTPFRRSWRERTLKQTCLVNPKKVSWKKNRDFWNREYWEESLINEWLKKSTAFWLVVKHLEFYFLVLYQIFWEFWKKASQKWSKAINRQGKKQN